MHKEVSYFWMPFFICYMKKKEDRGGISQSFVMGVIALVFMITGYHSALFMHNASLTKIAANRDEPDTVYVYREIYAVDGEDSSRSVLKESVERRNSYHEPVAASARMNIPRRRVESFRFNPNTVSLEDLCRLGFTPKQAQAIENYRMKGGKFRRKEDFARSFVVSDSIYARLESYIDIPPVDLNLADSAAFDALPGIGGWFASRIVSHREALGGFSYKEQLMDIRNFDQEKFDGLADLVVVSEKYMTPYPLWTLPADSLRMHPYIGDYAAKGVVLYRENNPADRWTVAGLAEAGIIKPESVPKLLRCIIAKP